ncbi:MAG: hypothetical protein ACI9CO_000046 [Candidatus Azotimanducaceae bacterium]|jgi:hypothetical protein
MSFKRKLFATLFSSLVLISSAIAMPDTSSRFVESEEKAEVIFILWWE